MQEVGPSVFFALLVITVSFLPIFALEEPEGRLFKPLAFTKTYAASASSLLAITLVPALMTLFIRGRRLRLESGNPVSQLFIRLYRPVLRLAMRFRWTALILNFLVVPATVLLLVLFPIGSEFMPPLYEGTLFYMPVTPPGLSVTEAGRLLSVQDRTLKSFPEVEQVFGKAGRAETATDPGAFLDDGNRGAAQAAGPVAASAARL